MTIAEYALLDGDGVVAQVIVIDEDSDDSRAVLELVVEADEGPHAAVRSTVRVDGRKTGYGRPAIGRKLRPDGSWKSDEYLARNAAGRRELRDGDEPGKPTGRQLDDNGEPRKGTELPAVSGKPADTPATGKP